MSTVTVYIKIEQKVLVTEPRVTLGQIGDIWCENKETRSKCMALKVCSLQEGKPQRVILSFLDIVRKIQEMDASVEVENLGEQDFILVYQIKKQSAALQWIKTALVCVLLFFGAAFAIITFNNDVDVSRVFDELYRMATGNQPQSVTPMEWGYVIGLPLGILGFYNHFSLHKRNADPTPLEIQMRQYEKNTNQAIIENDSRSRKEKT